MTTNNRNELKGAIKWSADGLVPAIVQDAQSKEVLMLAYMNEESLELSISTGSTWFWSRSRGELWNKGATSGHTQRIVSLGYDCDGDTLLVRVEQQGPACHTGRYSCFYNEIGLGGEVASKQADHDGQAEQAALSEESARIRQDDDSAGAGRFDILGKLETIIAQRHAERPAGAYTTYLFDKGVDKILKKVGEESAEVIIAAKNKDNDELRSEAGDLLFHLMVLMRDRGLPLDDIMSELASRHGKPTTNKMR